MSEMSRMNNDNNGVNGTGTSSDGVAPGRCTTVQQGGLGRHQVTACEQRNRRTKWKKEVNRLVIECWLRSEPTKRGYRKRMKKLWDEIGVFEASEQRLADQARAIRTNDWLSNLEIEEMKRKIAEGDSSASFSEEATRPEISESNSNRISMWEETETGAQDNVNENDVMDRARADGLDDEKCDILRQLIDRFRNDNDDNPPNLRYLERRKVKIATTKINSVISYVKTATITATNRLIRAAANVVADLVGYKRRSGSVTRGTKEPYWRKRIRSKVEKLRMDVSKMDSLRKGELTNERIKSKLEREYSWKEKGLEVVYEELKQRLIAVSAKLQRYDCRSKQFRQNRLFEANQKRLFEEIDGITDEDISPNADECVHFWSNIWEKESNHNEGAEWLRNLENDLKDIPKQEDIHINIGTVGKILKKMANWKGPGPDGVQGYWLKNFGSLQERIVQQLDRCLQAGQVPEWMTKGRTLFLLKDPEKGTAATNFRPITCLPLMWKLFTGVIAEELYDHLESQRLLPDEQKGCRKGCRGTKDQLLIDKMVIRNCKRRLTGLGVAWIDYKKAYDMLPHSWIIKNMDMFGVAENLKKIVSNSMKSWNTDLMVGGKVVGNVKIKRGIFQGDSLSPLLFVLAMIPLTLILRKVKVFYDLGKHNGKINHLLFMDDLKLFGKNENQLDCLINTVRVFTEDVRMEFGLEKCAVLVMKKGKVTSLHGITLPNGEMMKSLEKDSGYKYLGILEADEIKHAEMKKNLSGEYIRRLRKLLRSKLSGAKIILAINSRAVSVIRYGAGIVDWTRDELDVLDRKTRKLLTMHGAHHPKADIDRLYLKRSSGGRGLIGVKDCVDVERKNLIDYVKDSHENLLKAVKKEKVLNSGKGERSKEQVQDDHEVARMAKTLHSQFEKATEELRGYRSWDWLKKGNLRKETESVIIAAQDQAISTNNIRKNVYKEDISSMCRMCGKSEETIAHILNECPDLAQNEYKKWRHDQVAKIIHWKLCEKWEFQRGKTWYSHNPEKVLESEKCKILWDFSIQTDKRLEHNRPDIVVFDKANKKVAIIDPACPFDTRIQEKEKEKLDNYNELKYELVRLWNLKKCSVVPVVIGSLGTVTNKIDLWIKEIGVPCQVELLQKACLLGTSKIIRKVMNM